MSLELDSIKAKIVDVVSISAICTTLRKENKSIVFTNGCFDIIHPGHIHTIAKAKDEGNFLIMGLNSDASVKRLKGQSRPIQSQDARALILASMQFIDWLVIFDEDTPIELIKVIKPDVLVKGGDYTIDRIVGADFVIDNGGKVVTIPFVEGHSTTSIIYRT